LVRSVSSLDHGSRLSFAGNDSGHFDPEDAVHATQYSNHDPVLAREEARGEGETESRITRSWRPSMGVSARATERLARERAEKEER